MISMPANGIYIMASGISLGNGRYNKKEDVNMVFYFTATGNSLYVAKHFSEQPVSIPQIMQGTRRQFAYDSIGIICPVYAGQPPKLVLRFLQESDFQTDYFYMILTYGHDQSDSPEFTARLVKQYGIRVDYIGTIKMVDNYLPVFDMEEEMAIEKRVEEQLFAEKKAVDGREQKIPEATEEGRALHARVDNFYMEEGRARRESQTCEFCLACVQNCPQKAIGLRMADKNPNARYRNEHISLKEIIEANGGALGLWL